MTVKKIIRRLMNDLKNLKVSKDAHTRARIASLEDDVKLQDWIEAAIEIALQERNKVRRLLADRTKSAPPKASK